MFHYITQHLLEHLYLETVKWSSESPQRMLVGRQDGTFPQYWDARSLVNGNSYFMVNGLTLGLASLYQVYWAFLMPHRNRVALKKESAQYWELLVSNSTFRVNQKWTQSGLCRPHIFKLMFIPNDGRGSSPNVFNPFFKKQVKFSIWRITCNLVKKKLNKC